MSVSPSLRGVCGDNQPAANVVAPTTAIVANASTSGGTRGLSDYQAVG
jgi:hypothetical protein